jgi:hypothetical protein
LLRHADDDVMARVRRHAGSNEKRNGENDEVDVRSARELGVGFAPYIIIERGALDPPFVSPVNLKNFSAVSVVAPRSLLEVGRASGDCFRDKARVRGLASFSAKRHWREIGQSVSP